jgi:hypothetical protein
MTRAALLQAVQELAQAANPPSNVWVPPLLLSSSLATAVPPGPPPEAHRPPLPLHQKQLQLEEAL